MILHCDFEACSILNLGIVGADVWTRHPSTEPICLSFALDDGPIETIVWGAFHAKSGNHAQASLLDAVSSGAIVCAWNAPFEFAMWNNVCAPRFGWPELPIERFSCVMAAAACAGLPMKLEDAGPALRLPHVKDTTGQALMKRMARPRSVEPIVWWHDTDERKVDLIVAYNQQDVEVERAVHRAIPRMTERERAIWLIDQRMNQRGLPVDEDLRLRLHVLTSDELVRINEEIEAITGGAVSSAAQTAKLTSWLQARGYPLGSLAKSQIEDFTPPDGMTEDAKRVFELRREAAKTSTAKLNSIRAYAQADGRARHLTQYGGATRTLRWSGRGPQIHNFPRPIVKHVDLVISCIEKGLDGDGVRILFGRPLDVVSSCLRGVFRALPGAKFVVCDFNAVEARVVTWLAGFDELLEVFHRGDDVYVFTARRVGSNNRQFGKVLVLACGYGMGALRFQATARAYGITLTLEQALEGVSAWRETNRPIVSLWYAYERAAKNAILNPQARARIGRVTFRMADPSRRLKGSLLMELPSGRNLVYRNARIGAFGHVVYDGVSQYTHKWETIETYGGKLVENATQAVARDLLADALVELSSSHDEHLLTTVHDEIVAMAPMEIAPALYDQMRRTMRAPPNWAAGLPLDAQGYVSDRYQKG